MTMIGAQVGTDRVTFAINRPQTVWVDGNPYTLVPNTAISLSGGTLTELTPFSYQLNWNTGESITVTNYSNFLGLSASLGPNGILNGGVQGLLGTNINQQQDFTLPDGTVLPQPLTSAELYGEFANAWRVTQADSLLDYGTGQTTATFTDLNFPGDAISLENLPVAVINTAEQAVAAAGITDPTLAADAAYDFIATGDANFIAADAAAQQPFDTTAADIIQSSTVSSFGIGVMAASPTLVANATGTTAVTFDLYLTGTASSATPIDYTVVAPGTGAFDAATFG